MPFITNQQDKELKQRLTELINVSQELKFLVGFFYFSGLKEIYRALKIRLKSEKERQDFTFKILVGLEVDKFQHQLIELAENKNLTGEERIERYFRSIVKAINCKDFDNKEFYKQVRFFLNLIEKDKIIIRKTLEPNHAKLYIFKLDETQIGRRSVFITGSSNLTRAGLNEQREFNVEISDYGTETAEKYFDEEWERAIKITETPDLKTRLLLTLKEDTLIREITPFSAYVWVLKNYIDYFQERLETISPRVLLEKSGYKPFQYQVDAINQALSILQKHGGVIIADVVGLGKSVIASAVARILGKRGVVICPPAIMGDRRVKDSGWWGYLEDFGLTKIGWEVYSIGELEKLNEIISKRENMDIEVVIVDEAHRFRNQDTKSYELLKNITRGKKVILLTATPFNNRPSDILSLLKLFIIPKKSTISLEDDLISRFSVFKSFFDKLNYISKYHNSYDEDKRKRAQNYYQALFGECTIDLSKVNKRAKYLAKEIRAVIEPVTIRRNRLDLLKNPKYKEEINELSRIADPLECFFELKPEQMEFYDKIITYFFAPEEGGRFKGTMYRPFEYEKPLKDEEKLSAKESFEYLSQRNLYDIMRRLLVKRFESSFLAFKQSIINFKNITQTVIEFVRKTGKYILERKLIEEIYQLEPEDIEKRLKEYEARLKQGRYPKHHKVYNLKKFKRANEFLEDLKADLKMFEEILAELSTLELVENDPKFSALLEELKHWRKNEPQRKIVIFSEYADTVKYLGEKLENHFGERVLIAYGTLSAKKLKEIRENFDASLKEDDQRDDYDILVSTDKLSEGVNLNRAGVVVNYDIPWNPVRVIQRVGRINRISKKVFDELYIMNFFPTEKGSNIVKSREVASQKMFMIHKVLGEDAKIFDIDEEPKPSELYRRLTQNPDEMEEESLYTKLLSEFKGIKEKYPELIKKVEKFPPRLKVAKKSPEKEILVVFFKKYNRIYALKKDIAKAEVEPLEVDSAISLVRCKPNEPALPWNTDAFWENYEKVLDYRGKRKPPTEKSLERQALNVLNTVIQNFRSSSLIKPHWKFLLTLKEDLIEYFTFPDYTLRSIIEFEEYLKKEERLAKKIEELKNRLGEDYLEKEKKKLIKTEKEVILAVYNREGVIHELFPS